MSKKDAYEIVTERILEALDAGIVPWHKPWKSVAGDGPMSLSTGRPYRGVNVWILGVTAAMKGYESPWWVTFKQAKERGGTVRKGEKGTQIVLWKPYEREDKETGEKTRGFMLRYFTVFNLDQCDDIAAPEIEALPEHDPIEAADALSERFLTHGGPRLRHGGDRAYYSPGLDYVQMPIMGAFDTVEHYYGTLFHEYAHSTGHETRLKRKEMIAPQPFGTPEYSKEELVAEMTAAFLCGEVGIEPNVVHHASYIASWLKVLKDDRKLLVHAAGAAQKAADCVLGVTPAKKEEEPANGSSPRSTTGGHHAVPGLHSERRCRDRPQGAGRLRRDGRERRMGSRRRVLHRRAAQQVGRPTRALPVRGREDGIPLRGLPHDGRPRVVPHPATDAQRSGLRLAGELEGLRPLSVNYKREVTTMSAWVVSRIHIDVMLRYGLSNPREKLSWFNAGDATPWRQLSHDNATEIGRMLAEENVASVCHRYEQDTADDYRDILAYSYRDPGYTLEHTEVLNAVSCFEYQACEHDGWEGSEAKRFCAALRARACSALATGPWGWDEAALAERPTSYPILGR